MTDYCKKPYDDTLETKVMNASPDLYAICEGDIACLIEGSRGDLTDAIDSVTEQQVLKDPENPAEETVEDADSLEQDDVFGKTEAKGATRPEKGYTKGTCLH